MKNAKTDSTKRAAERKAVAAALSDFIERGRQAQETVDRILTEEARRSRSSRPKGKR